MEEINRRPYSGALEPNQILSAVDPETGEKHSWFVYRVFAANGRDYAAIILLQVVQQVLDLPSDRMPKKLPISFVRLEADRVLPLGRDEVPGVTLAYRMMSIREGEGDILPPEEG